MNSHKNARLTFARRLEMVLDMSRPCERAAAARSHGVTDRPRGNGWGATWPRGEAGLLDASSRPASFPELHRAGKALAIVELRRRRLTQARIAQALASPRHGRAGIERAGCRCCATSSRRAGSALRACRAGRHAAHRHQEARPHRAAQPPRHRQPQTPSRGAGWEFLFVAVDDHARIGFTAMHPDERKGSAVHVPARRRGLLRRAGRHDPAAAHRQRLGLPLQGLRRPAASSASHKLHPPLPPADQRQGRALHPVGAREWAYGFTYQHSAQRTAALDRWTHHYNWHRPHFA